MPRQVKKLAPLFVKGSLAAGVYNDGDGLRLIVDRNGSKRWSFRFRWQNREPEMGLGSYPVVTLADAREAAGCTAHGLAHLQAIGTRGSTVSGPRRPQCFGE